MAKTVKANNSTGARNDRVEGATDAVDGVNVLASRDGEAAEAAETTPTTTGKAATTTAGKMVRKRITAPSRLEKIRQDIDNGKPPRNVVYTRRAGVITAYELVPEKE